MVQLTVTDRWVDDMTIYQVPRSEKHEHEARFYFELEADDSGLVDWLADYCEFECCFCPQFGSFSVSGDKVIYSVSHWLDAPYYWDSWGISETDSYLRDDLPFLADAYGRDIAPLDYGKNVSYRHIISILRAWAQEEGHADLLQITAKARAEARARKRL